MAEINVKQNSRKKSQWSMVFSRLRKNKMAMVGLIILLFLIFLALFAPVIAPHDPITNNLRNRRSFPSFTRLIDAYGNYQFPHIMGTDNFGRDIFSRIIFGARVSLQIGLVSIGIATFVGGIIGAISGYYSGKFDNIMMRLMDILLAIPGTLLAISIVAALGSSMINLMIAIAIGAIPVEARVIRASVMQVREQEFVEAAKAVGTSDLRIIFKHILPNALAQIIVQSTLGVASAILIAAGLSFIGLGIQPPFPEWGAMLSEGRAYMLSGYWHMTVFPGLAIMLTIYALNLLGDGLRDALDPKLKR